MGKRDERFTDNAFVFGEATRGKPAANAKPARRWRAWLVACGVTLALTLAVGVFLGWPKAGQNPAKVDATTDIVDIYSLFVSSPNTAKTKYDGKETTVSGIIRHTFMTGNGAVVYLQHRRDDKAFRYAADKVYVPFPIQTDEKDKWDMGFEYQFNRPNVITYPWRDGEKVEIRGHLVFKDDGQIAILRAKLL